MRANPTIYFVRHGKTDANDDDPTVAKMRGYQDLGLDLEGVRTSKLAAEWLAATLRGKGGMLVSSDIGRTAETARVIGAKLKLKPRLTSDLRTWNIGELCNVSVAEGTPRLQALEATPSEPAPGGESFDSFYDRLTKTVGKLVRLAIYQPETPLIAVTHSSCIYALKHVLSGGESPMVWTGKPDPGGIVKVSLQGSKAKVALVFNPPDKNDKDEGQG